MEGVAPGLKLVLRLKMGLKSGASVRRSLFQFVEEPGLEGFKQDLQKWLTSHENGWSFPLEKTTLNSTHRRALLQVIALGLEGHSILPRLSELEIEFQKECERQIEQELADLPMKVLLPLTFCLFPAFMILLLGPLFGQFVGAFE